MREGGRTGGKKAVDQKGSFLGERSPEELQNVAGMANISVQKYWKVGAIF